MKYKGRNLLRFAVSLCCLWCISCQTWSEETPPLETKEFAKPSMPWRPIPLWFWNNTQVASSPLVQQLGQMVETDGYGGCAILPFGGGFRPECPVESQKNADCRNEGDDQNDQLFVVFQLFLINLYVVDCLIYNEH